MKQLDLEYSAYEIVFDTLFVLSNLKNLTILYRINIDPTTAFNIDIIILGIEALTSERRVDDMLKKTNVANPAKIPNIINSFLLYPFSIAFEVKRLVQKTIVNGFDMVIINADIKLLKIFEGVEACVVSIIEKLMTEEIIIIPKIASTIELTIPNMYFIRSFWSSFPTPRIASKIYI